MSRAGITTVLLFVVGAVMLILAEATWLRTASALVLVTSVAVGVLAIATPEFLAEDADEG